VSSRKEQKEALRQERLAREQAATQAAARKRLIGIVVAAVLLLGIVGALLAVVLAGGDDDGSGGGGAGSSSASVEYPDGGEIPAQKEADLAVAMEAAGCEDETVVDNPYDAPEGIHTAAPDEVIPYKSEPPALGRHYQVPVEDGIYDEAQPVTHVVHSLEHGRVIVWLRPDLSSDQLAQFKALYDEDPYHVIMTPHAELKEPFAVSAWTGGDTGDSTGHILRCKDVNENTWDAIRAFKEKYRDKAPEFVP
jgi:hypothetical protein